MGKYNFETAPNRLAIILINGKKLKRIGNVLPAWIADMDFEVLPEIQQAVHDYADHLVYGYTCQRGVD